jgi:hypothetical protein
VLLDVRLNVPHAQRRLLSNKTLIKCMSARVAQRTTDYPRGTNRLASTCEDMYKDKSFNTSRSMYFRFILPFAAFPGHYFFYNFISKTQVIHTTSLVN